MTFFVYYITLVKHINVYPRIRKEKELDEKNNALHITGVSKLESPGFEITSCKFVG